MFKFLLIAFLFFLFLIVLFGFSIIRFLFRGFGGSSRRQTQSSRQSSRNTRSQQPQSNPTPQKIITKDEGEYVDYEEIKD